jgi:hypothetical protein
VPGSCHYSIVASESALRFIVPHNQPATSQNPIHALNECVRYFIITTTSSSSSSSSSCPAGCLQMLEGWHGGRSSTHSIFRRLIVMSMLASRFGRFTNREMPVSTLWPIEMSIPCREFNSAYCGDYAVPRCFI